MIKCAFSSHSANMEKKHRRAQIPQIHAWLLLDKPHGISSTEALRRVKRLTSAKKIGHAGTLDPLATGLLPLAFGEATKTIPYLMNADKTYVFTIEWGKTTETLDAEGRILKVSDKRPDKQEIEAALKTFSGWIQQTPPQFSAIKVNGKRAYELARQNKEVSLSPRPVFLYEALLESLPSCDEAVFRLRTGKGFYIRSFVRDLAEKLGVCGYVKHLRRIKIGLFTENESILLEDFEKIIHNTPERLGEAFLNVETALADIPAINLQADKVHLLKQGRSIHLLPHQIEELMRAYKQASSKDFSHDEVFKVAVLHESRVMVIGEMQAEKLSPKRVFHYN